MAEIKFSQLTTAAQLTNDDIFALAQMQGGSLSSVKTSMIAIANFLNTQVQYTTAYNTQAKTTAGAINELKQLISLIPQFSIEVVEELPTEDISDTTIYLVPADDPETGNYYEEYIHVNDAWELVGTTAVDLSAYYTKLEVDGLLATKANAAEVTAALATKENKSDMPTDVRTIIKDCKTPKNATITNGIAQFECIEENLVKGLKVTMNPIQSGTGDPSPTNIRPISGRTEASVTRMGANQWDEEWEQGAYNSSGEKVTWSGAIRSKNTISVFPNSQYYIKFSGTTTLYICWYAGNSFIERVSISSSGVVTPPTNATKMTICTHNDYGTTYNNNISVNYPSTDTEYHAYTAETHTHQYSETICGGVDDFVNGEGSSDKVLITISDTTESSWSYNSTYKRFAYTGLQSVIKKVDNASVANIKSSQYVADSRNNIFNNLEIDGKIAVDNSGSIVLRDLRYTDVATFLQNEGTTQICYELATPTTISTSAEEITTVEGTNIISGTEPISECKYTELATVDDLKKIIGGQ